MTWRELWQAPFSEREQRIGECLGDCLLVAATLLAVYVLSS